jgi:hypothetical protein
LNMVANSIAMEDNKRLATDQGGAMYAGGL